jgi:class 3 adenylate cyclase
MMHSPASASGNDQTSLRLLLEEVCCDLCRFEHVHRYGCKPEDVRIDREYPLGDAFADIRVEAPGRAAYFVEVKFGYSREQLRRHLRRKYAPDANGGVGPTRVILVVSRLGLDREAVVRDLAHDLGTDIEIDIWDEDRLSAMMRELFQMPLQAITPASLVDLRQAIDRAKGFIAFGGPSLDGYEHDPLKAQLLWHFGFWRLRQLRERHGFTPRDFLSPGNYDGVAVLLADLCSFSSYVRDTPGSEIIRDSLTAFYSKARYQIINNGGMLYQFVGDEVIGLFGIPEAQDGFLEKALGTAEALSAIGRSVSQQWQRRIDRVQTSGGLHSGMAIGTLQIVSLRPFSRTHIGAIGDCINVAARLMSIADQGETVVSNAFYQGLPEDRQSRFRETEPIEARNVGRIKAWKLDARP